MSKPAARHTPRLPGLVAGGAVWRLPLTEYASFELARALVVEDLARRAEAVAELMSVAPSFALWTACHAGRRGSAAPRCVVDLAQWFSLHALAVLRWSDHELTRGDPLRDIRSRWRDLSANAIAVANLAASQAPDDAVAAEAFLLGLLHNGADWLRTCGPRISLAKGQAGCLPDWLVNLLRQRSRAPRSGPVQQVFSAIHLWREAGCTGRRVAGVDLSDVPRARKRWQETRSWDPAQPHFLQALVERLLREQSMRQQFDQALEQEKLAALGEFAYGASHEINNPLANISTRAQAMLLQEPDPEKRRMLAIIHTQALRANEMIADVMLFARPPEPVRRPVDWVAIVDAVLAELRDEADSQGTLLARLGGEEPLIVLADATLLAMAVRAVCVNALEALGAEGRVEVAVERAAVDGELGDWACLIVRDTGPGIPPHVRRHLFDPFFSGREAGRGLGLGLSKAWRVVTLHGGRIDVASEPREGTRFTIRLPLPLPVAESGAEQQREVTTNKGA